MSTLKEVMGVAKEKIGLPALKYTVLHWHASFRKYFPNIIYTGILQFKLGAHAIHHWHNGQLCKTILGV